MRRQRASTAIASAILALGVSATAGISQQGTSTGAPPFSNPPRSMTEPNPNRDDPFSGRLAEQQARSRNTDRQKRLVADTDRLLSLATELKQQVDKTDKNMLSVDVVKKADEIEKLAHSVKEKMKGGG